MNNHSSGRTARETKNGKHSHSGAGGTIDRPETAPFSRESPIGGASMSLIVTFQISGPPLELPNAAAEVRDVSLEIEQWRQQGRRVVWFLWANGEDLDRVTDALETLPNTTDVGVISGGEKRQLYRVSMVANVEQPPDAVFLEGTLVDGEIKPDCLQLTGRVSGRDVLTSVWQFLRSNDIEITVLRLSQADDEQNSGRLTDCQFEALATAHEMGYFEESEHVTQAEIADVLGISRSAFSERLRRAQNQLVEAQLGVAK